MTIDKQKNDDSLFMSCLASGSSGNATLIYTEKDALLIDCGLSYKKLQEVLDTIEYDKGKIRAIFITHEHSDHIAGLKITAKNLKIPVYCNLETSMALKHKKCMLEDVQIFVNGSSIGIEDFVVSAFSIPHDGVNTVAYNIFYNQKKIAVATDFGFPAQSVIKHLQNCDVLLLESNYDEDKLLESERPWKVKQRILGKHGHLSNESCQEILQQVLSPKLLHLILGHISVEANDVNLVRELTQRTFQNLGYSHIELKVFKQADKAYTIIL